MVEAFARELGPIPTPSLELLSVPAVGALTKRFGGSGTWNGEVLEGLVVRYDRRCAVLAH